ncbi:MAG: ABC transporter ATP-binding protein [Candidatus Poribacteria bacterium]|nr:ABC transporter ATP-binding protein [Candidatus Poribacteria bacterium]MDE0505750.1 ABC transporter ATP-binding protein [Candidatus Poribacteria bacterium]
MIPIFGRFVRYLAPYSVQILFAVLCAIVISICEYGYFHILAETTDLLVLITTEGFDAEPIVVRYFYVEGFFDGIPEIVLVDSGDALQLVGLVITSILILVVVKGVFTFCNDYLMSRVGHRLFVRVRNEMYAKILSAPLGVLREHRTGDLMSRVTDDVRTWLNSVGTTAPTIRAIVTVPVFVCLLFVRNFELTVFAVLVLPLLAYIISRVGKRVRHASIGIQQSTADIVSQLKETITGIKIIKSFTAEVLEQQRFETVGNRQYRVAMQRVRLVAALPPSIELISAVGFGAVFGFGCWQVIQGTLSPGWFIGYIGMIGFMFKPIKTIGQFNNVLQQCLASAERIFYILDFQDEEPKKSEKTHLPDVVGDVRFCNVSFGYDQRVVLKDINIHAKPGEVVALVGASGSGKTTLLNLLPRFYEVGAGEILIDDHSISEVTARSLRHQIAIVPQDTILFDGTVGDNISYGCPDATREEVVEAAQQANAHEFIMQMPNGYDTSIGESGLKLSGGQQQRISIARAILKNPRILILDEATSALDSTSEALVQDSLAKLMKGRTSFVIAHRLSTVSHADKIVVLDHGKVVEIGPHDELLKRKGLYQSLCKMQLR